MEKLEFNFEHMKNFWNGNILPNDHHHVVVACFPKSGSTYLSEMIGSFPSIKKRFLVFGHERREQELSPEILVLYHDTNYVGQHHLRCSSPTVMILKAFSIHPVVLVRNLYDVIVSLDDHYQNRIQSGSMAFVNEDIWSADSETRLNFFADLMAPWYINFFVSWSSYDYPATWITYEDLIGSEALNLKRIATDAKIDIDDAAIQSAIEQTKGTDTRLNKGVSGRGESLPQAVKDKIRRLTGYYPSIDFSPIGL